jgi:hypothetical protein
MAVGHRKDVGYKFVDKLTNQLKIGRKPWQDIQIPFVGNAGGKI